MSSLHRGDIVRYIGGAGIEGVFVAEESNFAYLVAIDSRKILGVPSSTLEVVERAWYAPVGVPMIQITPDRIKALTYAQRTTPAIDRSFESMLKDAREAML